MKRYESLYKLHRLLRLPHQRPLPLERLAAELECSERTVKRCLADLRDRFGHPIVFVREYGGYQYESAGGELPGLWFNESELTALLTMRQLLASVQPGLLERELVPLGRRIEGLLGQTGTAPGEVANRIRILAIGGRAVDDGVFRSCADAVLTRRRLVFRYQARGRAGAEQSRIVSPQRLSHYRDNWYLDAWCHTREDLRIFSLDQMREAVCSDEAALNVPEDALGAALTSSYGIFSGPPTATAVLVFSAERARWVAKETWHPDQRGRFLDDGRWELQIPYARPDELLLDILRYGADVRVQAPEALRELVRDRLIAAAAQYDVEESTTR